MSFFCAAFQLIVFRLAAKPEAKGGLKCLSRGGGSQCPAPYLVALPRTATQRGTEEEEEERRAPATLAVGLGDFGLHKTCLGDAELLKQCRVRQALAAWQTHVRGSH